MAINAPAAAIVDDVRNVLREIMFTDLFGADAKEQTVFAVRIELESVCLQRVGLWSHSRHQIFCHLFCLRIEHAKTISQELGKPNAAFGINAHTAEMSPQCSKDQLDAKL